MENEIKLEHIAGYLPHNLGIKIRNYKSDYTGISQSTINGYYFLGENLHVTYVGGNTGKSNSEFTPILRHLDTLEDSGLFKGWIAEHPLSVTPWLALVLDQKGFNCINILEYPLYFINDLYKNHFDINGLINKGLAERMEVANER